MTWLIGLAIVVAIVFFIVRRGRQMSRIARYGVAGEGEVVKKFRLPGPHSAPRIRYRFRANDGQWYENRVTVSESAYESLSEGGRIELAYVPDQPSLNAARYLVNQMRVALKLPEL